MLDRIASRREDSSESRPIMSRNCAAMPRSEAATELNSSLASAGKVPE